MQDTPSNPLFSWVGNEDLMELLRRFKRMLFSSFSLLLFPLPSSSPPSFNLFNKYLLSNMSDAQSILVNKTDVVSVFVKIAISCHLLLFFLLLHLHCHQQHPQSLLTEMTLLIFPEILIICFSYIHFYFYCDN